MAKHGGSPSGVIPIEALFGEGVEVSPNLPVHPREMVKNADVILGVDVMSRREFLLYGRETLERIADTGETETVGVLRIELDHDTDDLAKAIALIEEVKGASDGPRE